MPETTDYLDLIEAAACFPGDPETPAPTATPQEASKPIWEIFEEASRDIPDEVLVRLPTDLAAQVDHYVYGLPKR